MSSNAESNDPMFLEVRLFYSLSSMPKCIWQPNEMTSIYFQLEEHVRNMFSQTGWSKFLRMELSLRCYCWRKFVSLHKRKSEARQFCTSPENAKPGSPWLIAVFVAGHHHSKQAPFIGGNIIGLVTTPGRNPNCTPWASALLIEFSQSCQQTSNMYL